MTKENSGVGGDTGILQPQQLSSTERHILIEIDARLSEVPPLKSDDKEKRPREFRAYHYAKAENRRQRVLLLDGGRGSGKTSFLQTLINRWNYAVAPESGEPWAGSPIDVPAPSGNVRVIQNIEFDPLPPHMPLLAGLVHAWRPLAEFYDKKTFGIDDTCEDDDRPHLMDSWHQLFRVAAAGWSELPRSKGLIEDVLDREEQIRDWHYFREQWTWFVDEVIHTGRCLTSAKRLPSHPAFVIVIDDVDLQVERVHELLPALRLLTHDHVFFIVAADLDHLTEMLRFDFFGQQLRLAGATVHKLADARDDAWADELALAAVQKVFPIRNRWRMEALTLSELLAYPSSAVARVVNDATETIRGKLNSATVAPSLRHYRGADQQPHTFRLGDAMTNLAEAAVAAHVELRGRNTSYRSAEQLWQTIAGIELSDESFSKPIAEFMARLVSPDPRAPAIVGESKDIGAPNVGEGSATSAAPDNFSPSFTVEVPTGGELSASYFPGLTDPGGLDTVVLSKRAEFVYTPADPSRPRLAMSAKRSQFDFTAGLVAKTLQELNFPIDATALRWTTHLALVWTEWHGRPTPASFAWPWHTHPRPDQLLWRTSEWSKYLQKLGEVAESYNVRERLAYAWVYYERKSFFTRRRDLPVPAEVKDPLELVERREDFPWADLLGFVSQYTDREIDEWKNRTLPLLVRPEIGLKPKTQDKLAKFFGAIDATQRLRLSAERRELATNAILASQTQRRVAFAFPTEEEVTDLLTEVEAYHEEADGKRSAWERLIGSVAKQHGRKAHSPNGPQGTPRRNRR